MVSADNDLPNWNNSEVDAVNPVLRESMQHLWLNWTQWREELAQPGSWMFPPVRCTLKSDASCSGFDYLTSLTHHPSACQAESSGSRSATGGSRVWDACGFKGLALQSKCVCCSAPVIKAIYQRELHIFFLDKLEIIQCACFNLQG